MAKLKNGVLAEGLSGAAGSVVFVRMPGGGTYVRERAVPAAGSSPAQTAWRELMRRAGAAWRDLTPEEAEAWWAYAEAVAEERRRAGDLTRPNASGLYAAMAAKRWQYDPLMAPLRTPPSQAFTGDGLSISASSMAGVVRFQADGPNATGVATELLLQRLASRLARPQAGKDRHAGWAVFVPGGLSATVAARPGVYAASVRYLRLATGQTSGLVRVGVVTTT